MHAYLIVGANTELLQNKLQELSRKFNALAVTKDLIKIEDAREIFRFTSLGFSQKTAVIIERIDKATLPAQNAFLKPLEEPQKNVIYLLTTESVDNVLPTIVSRVEIINLNSQDLIDSNSIEESENFLNGEVGKQLSIISKIKDREKALNFLKNIISNSKTKLALDPKWLKVTTEAESARRALTANGNISIHLTRFVINSQ